MKFFFLYTLETRLGSSTLMFYGPVYNNHCSDTSGALDQI